MNAILPGNTRRHRRAVLIALAVSLLLANHSHAEDIDLFVMAGQSNMQGWQGDAAQYPADPQSLDAGTRFFWVAPGMSQSTGWTTMRPQGGLFPAGHFGPEVTFSRSLRQAGYNPAIFKYSIGSSSLANDWKGPGGGGLYDGMVTTLATAVASLESNGHQVIFQGYIWIQGESDAETPAMAQAYRSRLELLISDFTTNVVRKSDLLFLLGADEQHPWMVANPEVRQAQQDIASADPHIAYTSMIGLPKADSTHLTPAGLVLHGVRLYDDYVALRDQQVPANVTIDTFTAAPGAILPGGSSTLSWSTTNATSVSIDQGIGAVAVDGSRAVTPGADTTYTLTAQGSGGPVTQPVEVRVSQPVLTTIVVSPSSVTILANGSVALSAATLDQFGDPISGTVNWSVPGGGSLSPTTGSSTTFTSSGPEGTFTVTASSGSVQGSATVTVEPPPTITILEPVLGDVWYVGTTRRVTWTATGVNNFMVLYRQDGGAYSAISEGTMEYSIDTWTVPNSPSAQTEILVRDYFLDTVTSSVIFEIRSVTDSDGDGMDDFWEWDNFGDLSQDETTNADGDALTDYQEFMAGTDPLVPDSSRISLGLTCTPGSWGRPAASAFAAALLLALLSFGLLLRWRTSRRA